MTKWKRRVVHHFVYKDVTKTTAIFKCRSRTRCRCRSEILTSLIFQFKHFPTERILKTFFDKQISRSEKEFALFVAGTGGRFTKNLRSIVIVNIISGTKMRFTKISIS